jgi:hypothetical protein
MRERRTVRRRALEFSTDIPQLASSVARGLRRRGFMTSG